MVWNNQRKYRWTRDYSSHQNVAYKNNSRRVSDDILLGVRESTICFPEYVCQYILSIWSFTG